MEEKYQRLIESSVTQSRNLDEVKLRLSNDPLIITNVLGHNFEEINGRLSLPVQQQNTEKTTTA